MALKILFICGSLEAGRDGVGDYVRRLSLEITRHGHQVALAAINDRHISEVQKSTIESDSRNIQLLRLPEAQPENDRFARLQQWLDEVNPDWISLQFVPFSFNRKGLIFGLAKKLDVLGKGRKWHIMFHELWVGMDAESSKKELLWGMVQRYLDKELLKVLKPAVVHTHTGVYKKQLERLGADTTLLPLFSNIPVRFSEQVNGKLAGGYSETGEVDLVIFGGIHSGAPIVSLAKEAAGYEKSNGLKIRLVIIGKSGNEQLNWINEWKAAGLTALPLGEQTEEKVSELLAAARFGIFTTPIALVEKSGSVAAMREHGVQLLCVARPWNPRKISVESNPFGIQEYKEGNLGGFFKAKPDFSFLPVLTGVAEQFIANLKRVY